MFRSAKSNDRISSQARSTSATRWIRPLALRTLSSSCWTPRLTRLTPADRRMDNFSRVVLLGEHSKVISSASDHENTDLKRSSSVANILELSNDGVPPPKYTNCGGRPANLGRSAYSFASSARQSTYCSISGREVRANDR